jgi:phenylpropionate dioxygenase-like ring-hydroxylating dioxygenase large terminal subunit
MFLGLTNNHQIGEVKPLPHYNLNKSLVRNNSGFFVMSNVCPHQNARLTSIDTIDTLTCPYHGMQFDTSGVGIGNSFCLHNDSTSIVGNMIFGQTVSFVWPIDLSYMELDEFRIDSVRVDPKIVLDVFLDIEHIPVAHPGVYDAIAITDISKIKYDFFDNGSNQYVTADNDQHIIDADRLYNLGALWTTVYPATTIEWQPGALFVNVALDDGRVLVYKYKDSRYSATDWKLNSDVWETAWHQDRELCQQIAELPMTNLDPLKSHHRNWINNAV